MSTEVELLRLMRSRDSYDKYHKFVKDYTLYPEAGIILGDIGEYFKYHPECTKIDWPDFQTWFRINKHPGWKPEQHALFKTILDTVAAKDEASSDIVDRFIELDYGTQISEEITKLFAESNTGALAKVSEILSAYTESTAKGTDDPLVSVDAETLFGTLFGPSDGLEWRLEDLNRSIGPVRRGDLVFIGKRPEVGGTTFVTSEFSHMAAQLPEGKHAIIFNNEEIGSKVGIRVIQSTLDCTIYDIMADPKATQANYLAALAGHRIDVYHDTSVSVSDVERVLRTGEYGLIAINILDKVNGFNSEEGVARLRALAQWARRLADKYGVVFAVAQADASAEGQRYLDQSQLYGSKTGMQGEGDIQLMIGKDNNPGFEDIRFFNIVKNKTLGGVRTDPKLRHGKFEVAFDGERGRFRSIAWT